MRSFINSIVQPRRGQQFEGLRLFLCLNTFRGFATQSAMSARKFRVVSDAEAGIQSHQQVRGKSDEADAATTRWPVSERFNQLPRSSRSSRS